MSERVRYEIKGKRPGSTLYILGRFVKPHEDGGYVLNESQLKALKDEKLEVVTYDPAAAAARRSVKVIRREGSRAAERAKLEANKLAADEHNAKTNRAPTKADALDTLADRVNQKK